MLVTNKNNIWIQIYIYIYIYIAYTQTYKCLVGGDKWWMDEWMKTDGRLDTRRMDGWMDDRWYIDDR